MLVKKRPIHLTYFVTRRCNAGCPYCFYLKGARSAATAGHGAACGELSLDEVAKVSSSLGRLLWLSFSGGEPYLRRDLAEISRVFYHQNRPSFMLYPTNGSLPEAIEETTERILRFCPRSVVAVKLSLDGLHGAHDALRRSPGAFAKAMETYRRLAGLLGRYPNFELGINTVLLSENQDSIDDIIDFVDGLQPRGTHTISLVRGDLAVEGYKSVDPDRYARAIDNLERRLRDEAPPVHRFRGSRLKAAQDVLQRRLIHRTLRRGGRQIPCQAGRLSLVLTESGGVYPCEILADGLGNVRDHGYDMRRLLRSAEAGGVLASLSRGSCACTHECNMMMNILSHPRSYPALAAEYLRLRGAPIGGCPAVEDIAVGPDPEKTASALEDAFKVACRPDGREPSEDVRRP